MSDRPIEPPLNEGTVKSMKGNKGRGTKPELIMRKALRDAGYPGYRLNWKKAPGHPDICYPGRKVAVFVNGCFWHQCPVCRPSLPKHNADYWIPKLQRNVERDREEISLLESQGWTVVTVWECEVRRDLPGVTERVVDALERTSRMHPRQSSPLRSSVNSSRRRPCCGTRDTGLRVC